MSLNGFLGTLLAGAAAGLAGAIYFGLNAPVAFVQVSNGSGRAVAELVVTIDTCAAHYRITRRDLDAGGTTELKVPVCGEGGYVLHATLADGTRLESDGRYVERGYRTAETLSAHGVDSRYLGNW